MSSITTWVDSEQVLHAKQALSAYEHDRAAGNVEGARDNLVRARDACLQAWIALMLELDRTARRTDVHA